MAEAVTTPYASSIYRQDLAIRTWDAIKDMRRGTAIFTMPADPIKCPGAPQKIAYLAADWWRRRGVLNDIRIVLVLPTPTVFGIPVFAKELERVVARYGIEVRLNSETTEIDPVGREVVVVDHQTETKESIHYDFLHTVPPQSAPDWLKNTALAVPGSCWPSLTTRWSRTPPCRWSTFFGSTKTSACLPASSCQSCTGTSCCADWLNSSRWPRLRVGQLGRIRGRGDHHGNDHRHGGWTDVAAYGETTRLARGASSRK